MPNMLWPGILILLLYLIYRYSSQIRRRLPPGPKPLPLLGNIRDFPPPGVPEFQHWLKHKDQYGGISSVSALGMILIIMHDRKIVHDILEQASSKTPGRPRYTTLFRRYRKLLHQELGTKVSAAQFRDTQEFEVNRQLVRSLRRPEDWVKNFQTTAGATILKTTYGYTVEPEKSDALVEQVEKMMKEFSLAATPLAWTVDLIPILRYLPEWLPGASFKKISRAWKKSVEGTAYMPYQFVQRKMAASCHRQSYVSRLVEQCKKESKNGYLSPEDEHAITWTAANLYAAGADTTVVTMTAFTLAMILFPKVQRKAQEEIDRVVGTDRLPGFEDRERLPYINALVKEAIRWWSVTPLGFTHTVGEDMEYNGYFIPKGAYLLPAIWWFLHDPKVYADPETFEPERFLSPRNEPDPMAHAFGYGRRICPGRFFGEASLYINIAKSLAVFNINKAVGKDGKEVDVEAKTTPGVLSYLNKFQFRITPRSAKHVDLVKQLESKHLWDEGDSEMIENIRNQI